MSVPESLGSAVDRATIGGLLDATGGDAEFVVELIDAYLVDAPLQVRAIRVALEAGAPADVRMAAHTLKSTSASLGALGLAERCRSLEAQARDGTLPDATQAVGEIEAELESVVTALSELRSGGLAV